MNLPQPTLPLRATLCALVVTAALTNAAASAAPFFQGLGFLPGKNTSAASDVSADGKVVVGSSSTPGVDGSVRAFRWSLVDGMTPLNIDLPMLYGSVAGATSADGSVIAGTLSPTAGSSLTKAFYWTAATGAIVLDNPIDTKISMQSTAVSPDGSSILGNILTQFGTTTFRWSPGTGYNLVNNFRTIAISPDGSTLVGRTGVPYALGSNTVQVAAYWNANSGVVPLGHITPFSGDQANAASSDGSVIVGTGAFLPFNSFRWTSSTGFSLLSSPFPSQPPNTSVARDLTADGLFAVGTSVNQKAAPPPDFSVMFNEASYWDFSNGTQGGLKDWLTTNYGLGAALTAWTLTDATAISPDGHTIVGYGKNPAGQTEAWIAHVPEPSSHVMTLLGGATAFVICWRRRRNFWV